MVAVLAGLSACEEQQPWGPFCDCVTPAPAVCDWFSLCLIFIVKTPWLNWSISACWSENCDWDPLVALGALCVCATVCRTSTEFVPVSASWSMLNDCDADCLHETDVALRSEMLSALRCVSPTTFAPEPLFWSTVACCVPDVAAPASVSSSLTSTLSLPETLA